MAVLGTTFPTDGSAGSNRQEHRTNEQVLVCIAEISRYADYSDASRVVHWVTAEDQRRTDGMKIKVETSVFVRSGAVSHTYSASCLTGTFGDLVKFKIDGAVTASDSED